ncbi:MAG: glycosyltransferase [Acidobacteria bacterium]|nr:glycosyltransferase [Acidobacteriota bacterium]
MTNLPPWNALTPASPRASGAAPLVSVIVPTYNRPHLLLDAVASVLAQSLHDVEVIVVNDAGVDVGEALAALTPGAGHEVRYLSHAANAGLAAARNTGLRAARGRFVAYLDDDDRYLPDHLETLVRALETGDAAVAYTDAADVTIERRGDGEVVTQRLVCYSRDFSRDDLLVENLFPVLCVMHRRSCVTEVGVFDESLSRCEDWEFWIRLSRRFDFVHVPKVTAEYTTRIDGTSMRTGDPRPFLAAHRTIYARYALWASERIRHRQAAAYMRFQDQAMDQRLDDEAADRAGRAAALCSACDASAAAGDRKAAQAALEQLTVLVQRDRDESLAGARLLTDLGDVTGAAREFQALLNEPYERRLDVRRLSAALAEAGAARQQCADSYASLQAWRGAALTALDLLRLARRKPQLFVWGAGAGGRATVAALQAVGVRPVAVLDSLARTDSGTIDGIPIVPPTSLDDGRNTAAHAGVIIASVAHAQIAALLDARGWRVRADYVVASLEALALVRDADDAS